MPPAPQTPHDEEFARRLFAPEFRAKIDKFSKPVYPKTLEYQKTDIIQRALIKAYEKRHTFRGKTDKKLLGWVLRILENLTRDILRARKRLPKIETLRNLPEGLLDRQQMDPAEIAEESEQKAELPPPMESLRKTAEDVLGILPERDREILRLYWGKELTLKEIAELLTRDGTRMTPDGVKKRLYRAQEKINRIMEALGLPALNPRRRKSQGEKGP